MRIVIDLQGAQTSGSRNRGIGRYSTALTKSIIRNRGGHEVVLALNGAFADTIGPLRDEFGAVLPQENIHVWPGLAGVRQLDPGNGHRRRAAELCRETFLSNLRPDILHVSSLFEGLDDDAVVSVGKLGRAVPTSVTLYDLIPHLNRSPYLENPVVERWYLDRLDNLRRADLLLSISASSRTEAIDHLSLPEGMVRNIGTAADPQFRKIGSADADREKLRTRHGISRPFVMYTGGIDFRKNIERLIEAFATLPAAVRSGRQLAIVCSIGPDDRDRLQGIARNHGLTDLILTGYVAEDELIALYNLCELFVFPSWHEGFGLPALEAMYCDAVVIGSDRSSIPEVIGSAEGLFDPLSVPDMRDAIARGLTDGAFRERHLQHLRSHRERFSWDATGREAIAAMEAIRGDGDRPATAPAATARLGLALVSPLPPARSGIADYVAELIPELSRHYDITVVVKDEEARQASEHGFVSQPLPVITAHEFRQRSKRFDRVLYHIGNSPHHDHAFGLIEDIPGVVVQHDFYLSGIMSWAEAHFGMRELWSAALYRSHGYPALDLRFNGDASEALWRYPCSLDVLSNAIDVIVHSQSTRKLGEYWGGKGFADSWTVIPHLVTPVARQDRAVARKRLGIADHELLVCSFGIMGPTKQNLRLVHAWMKSKLGRSKSARLVFVGQPDEGAYGEDIERLIAASDYPNSITVTGWAEPIEFAAYLTGADFAVQLRTRSRGETSGAALDCMNYGLPVIVNANGAMADLTGEAVWMLPDDFTDDGLEEALTALADDTRRRKALGQRAQAFVRERHSPRACADAYAHAIERAYDRAGTGRFRLATALRQLGCDHFAEDDLAALATAASGSAPPVRCRTAYVVIEGPDTGGSLRQDGEFPALKRLLAMDCEVRIEPIYFDRGCSLWRYARRASLDMLGIRLETLHDDPVVFAHHDLCLVRETAGKLARLLSESGVVGLHALEVREVVPATAAPGGGDRLVLLSLEAALARAGLAFAGSPEQSETAARKAVGASG